MCFLLHVLLIPGTLKPTNRFHHANRLVYPAVWLLGSWIDKVRFPQLYLNYTVHTYKCCNYESAQGN
jgi:hypothetical protein